MTTRTFVSMILAAGLAASAHPTAAVTRHVPAEYATINQALDASAAGDSVLVAPGTYTDYEVRDLGDGVPWKSCAFLKAGVVLRSEGGSSVTTIDMQHAPGPQAEPVLARNVGPVETPVEGFTITGAPVSGHGAFVVGRVTFRDCVFRDLDAGGSDGAGIAANAYLTLFNCEFANCVASGGGAIAHYNGRIEMYDCWVHDCGRIAVLASGAGFMSSAQIEGCTFEDCFNPGAGGGALQVSNHLGGVTIRGCVFEGNEAGSAGGAGMALGALPLDGGLVENCLFINNRAVGGNGMGGGLKATATTGWVTVRGCTFWGNYAPTVSGGAAVALGGNGSVLTNNIIAGSLGYGAVFAYNITMQSTCNVFWQNAGGQGTYYTPGPTDRVVDPLLCDVEAEDFHVMVGSPCLPPGSLGCGQIGLYGEGCGTVSVDAQSWGEIKSAYRAP